MTISIPAKPTTSTAEDLERLSHEGYRYELIQGELRPMSPSGGPHGDATSRVSFYVNSVVYGSDLGRTFAAETGFLLSRNPDTDLAVETRSPNDSAREVAAKVDEWLAAGVQLVWVIEPKKPTITTHRAGRSPQILGVGNTLDGEEILPGLSVPVECIFPPRRN